MLPQLPFALPDSLALLALPALPVPPSLPALPAFLSQGSAWAWVLTGAAVAVICLWALRRARRMVLAATLGVTGLVLAWNAGFLPLAS